MLFFFFPFFLYMNFVMLTSFGYGLMSGASIFKQNMVQITSLWNEGMDEATLT